MNFQGLKKYEQLQYIQNSLEEVGEGQYEIVRKTFHKANRDEILVLREANKRLELAVKEKDGIIAKMKANNVDILNQVKDIRQTLRVIRFG